MGNQTSISIEQYEDRILRLEQRVLELEQKVFLKLNDSTIRTMHHPPCVVEPSDVILKTDDGNKGYNGLPSSLNTAFASGQCAGYITPLQTDDKNKN